MTRRTVNTFLADWERYHGTLSAHWKEEFVRRMKSSEMRALLGMYKTEPIPTLAVLRDTPKLNEVLSEVHRRLKASRSQNLKGALDGETPKRGDYGREEMGRPDVS